MPQFAIIAPASNDSVTNAVNRVFPGRNYQFAPGQFVAAGASLTANQVAQALGANGEIGRVIVFSIAGYWGYHDKNLWEWLKVNPG